jgi:hypothetical protein
MTFQEAVEYKNSFKNQIFKYKDVNYKLFVSPNKQEDYLSYIKAVYQNKSHSLNDLNDEYALLFSTDNDFVVIQIGFLTRNAIQHGRVKLNANPDTYPY